MPSRVTHADNFKLAVGEIEAKVVPIRLYNIARATNLFERDLVVVMRRFKARVAAGLPWRLKFEDGSEYAPTPNVLRPIQRLQGARAVH